MKRLRNLFSPPPGSRFRRRALPFLFGGGLLFVALLLILPPAWEYSNSAQFCGTTCHTMPPQFKTYLASAHARVPCVDCHIGRDLARHHDQARQLRSGQSRRACVAAQTKVENDLHCRPQDAKVIPLFVPLGACAPRLRRVKQIGLGDEVRQRVHR